MDLVIVRQNNLNIAIVICCCISYFEVNFLRSYEIEYFCLVSLGLFSSIAKNICLVLSF